MLYQGREGLKWWTGVVEDRNDPLFLNRVRVRIYGAHSHQKDLIATPDLPWSQVLMPTTSPSLSGLGITTHGLVEGSTVMGFYRDGINEQDPVVMGSFIGAPKDFSRIDETVDEDRTRNFTQVSRKPSEGFNDPRLATAEDYNKDGNPDGKNSKHINRNYGLTLALDESPREQGGTKASSYPKESYTVDGSSDVNKLALGDSTFYPVIAEAKGEPARSNYVKPIYPFNNVHETESGHVIELDDTPEYERLHAYHRTGTRVEIDKDGTYIEKIVKDKFTVIIGDDTVKIQGAVDIEVGDSLAANAIATAGGATELAETTSTDIVDAEGKLTTAAKANLIAAGVDTDEVQKIVDEEKLGDKIKSATEEALDTFDDVKNNATLSTIVDTVEGVNQGADGITSVVDQVSEHIGGEGLSDEASTIITSVLSGAGAKDIVVAKGVEIVKDKLTDALKDSAVVDQIEGKLNEILGGTSIESMKAVVSEKVSAAVTDVVSSVLGEEVGAKAAEVISGQMVNAVSSVALGAVMGALGGGALVNISVAGGTKIHSTGSTSVISEGSTSITSGIGTDILTLGKGTKLTTLLGDTTISSLVGTINLTAPAGMITATAPVIQANATGACSVMAGGAISLTAPTIFSEGIWNHQGVMNVNGLLTGTIITAPVITSLAATLGTHQHTIVGTPANALSTGPLPPTG